MSASFMYRLEQIGKFLRFGLPKLPLLNGYVDIGFCNSCECTHVESYGLLSRDFPSLACDCVSDVEVAGLYFAFDKFRNPAYISRRFYFSFKWFAVYTPAMLRDFLLACAFNSWDDDPDFSHDTCTVCGRDLMNLFAGKCFDCRVVLGFKSYGGCLEDYIDSFVETICDFTFLPPSFFRNFYRENLSNYLINLFSSKVSRKKVAQSFAKDHYATPFGCPNDEDPLKFVITKIVAQGEQGRLYGDYRRYKTHLSSAKVCSVDYDRASRGAVLTETYEQLRQKVLTRP